MKIRISTYTERVHVPGGMFQKDYDMLCISVVDSGTISLVGLLVKESVAFQDFLDMLNDAGLLVEDTQDVD